MAGPICEIDDCEDVAVCDLHVQGQGCLYLCVGHQTDMLSLPNWEQFEVGAHPRKSVPIIRSGLTTKDGRRVELDGTPARERAWRP